MPPTPIGCVLGVADEEIVAGERAILSIERGEVLTLAGETDSEPSPAECLEVVGVVRLVEFQHHVVADVDDVADRPHAGGGESARHPVRRRLDLDAGDDGRGEPGASITVDDLDVGDPLVAGDDEGRSRWPELDAHLGGDIACDPDVSPAVGTVAGDIGVDQHVGGDAQRVAVGDPEGRLRRQDTDTGVVVAETEFGRRAEHALGVDAEDAASLDGHAVGHGRAECGQRHDVADGHVERAAPDVPFDAVAGVHVDALDLGGVGMLFEAQDARGHHTRNGVADGRDRVDLEAE